MGEHCPPRYGRIRSSENEHADRARHDPELMEHDPIIAANADRVGRVCISASAKVVWRIPNPPLVPRQ